MLLSIWQVGKHCWLMFVKPPKQLGFFCSGKVSFPNDSTFILNADWSGRLGRRGTGPIGGAFAGGSCRDAIDTTKRSNQVTKIRYHAIICYLAKQKYRLQCLYAYTKTHFSSQCLVLNNSTSLERCLKKSQQVSIRLTFILPHWPGWTRLSQPESILRS